MKKLKTVISVLHLGKIKLIGPNPQKLVGVMPTKRQYYKYFLKFTANSLYKMERIYGLNAVSFSHRRCTRQILKCAFVYLKEISYGKRKDWGRRRVFMLMQNMGLLTKSDNAR